MVLNVERKNCFQMSDEDDEEIQMIVDQKSRFSRYRTRIREKTHLDVTEMMAVDDPNDTSCVFSILSLFFSSIVFQLIRDDEIINHEQQIIVPNNEVSTMEYDGYNQELDSVLNEETKQCAYENNDDNGNILQHRNYYTLCPKSSLCKIISPNFTIPFNLVNYFFSYDRCQRQAFISTNKPVMGSVRFDF